MPARAGSAPFPIGVFVNSPNGSVPSAEAAFEQNFAALKATLNITPTLIDVYVDYNQPFSSFASNASWQAWSNAQSPVARRLTPVIGLPMQSFANGSPSADQQFQQIASGKMDGDISGVLRAWSDQGFQTLIFRPGWEMNIPGPTYSGNASQSEADWTSAFRRIYTVLHKAADAAGVNVEVVWNPNATNYSDVVATSSLYPGDGYVDAVGADIYGGMYPFSDGSGTMYHDWHTGQEDYSLAQFIAEPVNRKHYWTYPAATEWSLDSSGGHSQSFLSLLQFARRHKKPFAVPETGAGSSDAGNDVSDEAAFPQWLGHVLESAKSSGMTISFVSIWDANDNGNYEFSYPSDQKPREAHAWGLYFGAR